MNKTSTPNSLLRDAARHIRDAFTYDPGHSDLDDEQPISINVTLGDWRKLDMALLAPSEIPSGYCSLFVEHGSQCALAGHCLAVSEKLPINKIGAPITVSSTEPQFDPTLPSDIHSPVQTKGEAMKHLLTRAMHEIERLRRRNEILQAQSNVVAAFSAALLGRPQEMGMEVDVVWELREEIAKLDTPKPTAVER